ncbi:MAG TPA: alpha/beta fold hydrolase [Symbiobacteriaceae bacterium]|jgi:hypothetical protein
MPNTHPVTIGSETHGLAGNLVLPDGAAAGAPVPGAVIVGGPGPLPQQRYSSEGAKQWPVLWSEALGAAGVGAVCYDQRGSGLSTGAYHEADRTALCDDARAFVEVLALQPEVGPVAAVAWGEGCGFALQLAAEGVVHALVLMAPPFHTEEARYGRSIARLAASKGLSDRVVQVRIDQWRNGILSATRRVQEGETTTTVDLGGQPVTTSLVRFLQNVAFDPAPLVRKVNVPVLLLHGDDDQAIPASESEAMARELPGPVDRITYPGVAHFLYRHPRAIHDAAAWIKRTLSHAPGER